MNDKDEALHLVRHKISMYIVLIVLFFLFDFLLGQNQRDVLMEQFGFAKHRFLYIFLFILFASLHLIYHYYKMIKRKRKIPNENSNEYYQLLLEEYNRYERALLLSDKKLGFLQEISPIIITFVFLQGLFEKMFTKSIQMEFSEILGFVIVLFYVFFFMETWHTYKLNTGYLLRFKNKLSKLEQHHENVE